MDIKELIKEMPYPKRLFDINGNQIYFENEEGFWERKEYNKNNKPIFSKDCNNLCYKTEYNSEGKVVLVTSWIPQTAKVPEIMIDKRCTSKS